MQMKGKSRQEVIKGILRTYGQGDLVDALCLGVRFHVEPEVISEDVRRAGEALQREASAQQREALAQQRATALDRERAAELEVARRILKTGGA
jgi:hypothetical protein